MQGILARGSGRLFFVFHLAFLLAMMRETQ